MIEWRIYYADGSTFDNEDGPPEAAPCDGVLVVGQVDPKHNWDCRWGDWFVYRDDEHRWYHADYPGLFDHVKHFAIHIRAVLQGRYVRDDVWNAIWRKAQHEDALPNPTPFMHECK